MKFVIRSFCVCFLLLGLHSGWAKDSGTNPKEVYEGDKCANADQVGPPAPAFERWGLHMRNMLKLGVQDNRLIWNRDHWKRTLPKLEVVKPQTGKVQSSDKRVKRAKAMALNDPRIDKPTCSLDVHIRKLIQVTKAKQFHMGFFKKMVNKGLMRKHGWKQKPGSDDFFFLREEFYGKNLFCSVEGEAERLMVFFKENDFHEEGKSVMMKTQGMGDLRIELTDQDLMFVLDQSRSGKIRVFMSRADGTWVMAFDHFKAFRKARPKVVHDVVFPLLASFQIGLPVDANRSVVRNIANHLLDKKTAVDPDLLEGWIEALNDAEPGVREKVAEEISAQYVHLEAWVSQQLQNPEISLEGQAQLKKVYSAHEETRRILRDLTYFDLLQQPAFLVALLKDANVSLSEKVSNRLGQISKEASVKNQDFDWLSWWQHQAKQTENQLGK